MSQEQENKCKIKATFLSIISNSILIILKIFVGIISGSFSIISEAIHSTTDLLASFVAYFAVKMASEPADKEHSFGHGKFEDFSGLIEGILIILAGLFITYEAIKKILHPTDGVIIVNYAIYAMILSIIINVFVSKYLFDCAKKTGSIALYADAQHLKTDVLTSIGVLIGLFAIKTTNINMLDSIIAIVVAVLIGEAGFKICKKTISDLLDASLEPKEEKEIISTINDIQSNDNFKICKFKSRRSGVIKNIELTICVNENMTVKDSHDFCNQIEKALEEKIGHIQAIIHIEPACLNCSKLINNH